MKKNNLKSLDFLSYFGIYNLIFKGLSMAKMTIVGSGILGLSVAEFLSRKIFLGSDIQIITNLHKYSASKAAAANLATKGQLFGREKHFQLKLEGKRQYFKWISLLLNETQNITPIDTVYKNGFGVDYFTSQDNREKHFNRVKQNDDELFKRGFPNNSIIKIEENKINYVDEAWIDAQFLLSLLKDILIKRRVSFIQSDFGTNEYHHLLKSSEKKSLIFCTGVWTKYLLNKLDIKLPHQMLKQERITIGSTYFGDNILNNFDQKFILHEIISDNLKEKVTFSGNKNKQFISSSTLKLNSINELEENSLALEKKNIELLNLAKNTSYNSTFLKDSKEINITKLNGVRVGFGHSEIVLEKLNIPNTKINAIVCAGAHKSGYLFAPVVGFMMQNLLLGNS